MNKRTIILVAILLVVLTILTTIFLIVKINQNIVKIVESAETYSEKIVMGSQTLTYKNIDYDVEMKVPQFYNLDSSLKTYINNKISSDLSYINVYNEMLVGISNKKEAGKFSYETSFERYNCDDFISLVVHQNASLENGRAKNNLQCYVVDAKKNKLATLQDVMANKIDYRRKIKDEVEIQAFKDNIEIKGGNGLGTIPDNQKFYIKDRVLHICFDEAEIAPAAFGILDFSMPFSFENNTFTY